MVQFELKVKGEWYPIVRYDTAHDAAHQDIMHWKMASEKKTLPGGDYNLALSWAEEDLRRNWELHRERFLREAEQQ